MKGVQRLRLGNRIGGRVESNERGDEARRDAEQRLDRLERNVVAESLGAIEPGSTLTAAAGGGILPGALAAATATRATVRAVVDARVQVERPGAASDGQARCSRKKERQAEKEGDASVQHGSSI